MIFYPPEPGIVVSRTFDPSTVNSPWTPTLSHSCSKFGHMIGQQFPVPVCYLIALSLEIPTWPIVMMRER